jgi:protein-S-isoprenylcysteine O-methyltransferase Ste14
MSALPPPKFPKPYADLVQRLRVPAGFALLAALIVLSRPSIASLSAGAPVSLLGLALRAWAAGHLAKNESLAATGPYAMMRNPLYLGSLLAAAGLAIASASAWVGVIAVASFVLIYFPVIEQEEQHLAKLFPEYAVYAARVPQLIPRSLRLGGGFRWALYTRNQEYKAAGAVAVAYVWLGWLAGR